MILLWLAQPAGAVVLALGYLLVVALPVEMWRARR